MQAADRMVALTRMPTLFFAFCITMRAADLTDQPAFSGQGDRAPDGQRILYTSNESGTRQLYSVDADVSDRQRLTTTQFNETFPSYASDGKYLLFYPTAMGAGRSISRTSMVKYVGSEKRLRMNLRQPGRWTANEFH